MTLRENDFYQIDKSFTKNNEKEESQSGLSFLLCACLGLLRVHSFVVLNRCEFSTAIKHGKEKYENFIIADILEKEVKLLGISLAPRRISSIIIVIYDVRRGE